MLSIRLQRVGRVHEPVFRLVLTDSKNSTKSGKFLEILGSFDARHGEDAKFNNEKILYWISKGAQTSATVHNLLVSRKLLEGKKRNVLSRRPVSKVAEPTLAPEPITEAAPTTEPEAPTIEDVGVPTPPSEDVGIENTEVNMVE